MNGKTEKLSVIEEIKDIVGSKNVLTSQQDLICASYDASLAAAKPVLVVNFENAEHIAPVVKALNKAKLPFVPRAAGTNLCGAAINLAGGVVLNMAGLKKIRQIDTVNRLAVVEPAVVNLTLQEELKKFGFFYAPDPASQKVCTIGGNIAENAGGPRCLRYGVTCDHVEKLEVVLPDGSERTFSRKDPGPNIMSVFCQSEGTLGIIKTAWLKILPIPKKVTSFTCFFEDVETSMKAVSMIIASGIVPTAMEEVDALSIEAAGEKEFIPEKAKALLIVELEEDKPRQEAKIIEIFSACQGFSIEKTSDPSKREKLWRIRKESYPALARIGNNVMVEDAVVPRPKLAEAVKRIKSVIAKNRLTAGLVFHAGDGNIHPNIVFDQRDKQETLRVKKASEEILKICIDLDGDISGEHGVGVEKRKAMNLRYTPETLIFFKKIKDAIDPNNLANPDKKIPLSIGQIKPIKDPHLQLTEQAREILEELKNRSLNKIKTVITSKDKKGKNGQAVYLSCAKLRSVKDFDKENMTITVEAGMTISELKRIVKDQGLDISLPSEDISIAAAFAVARYENMANLVTAAEMADAQGSLISIGGKTIKSVSGYNIFPLITGSKGAFTFILSLTIKLNNPEYDKSERRIIPPQYNGDFSKDPLLIEIKKALDPFNLLNPHIFHNL